MGLGTSDEVQILVQRPIHFSASCPALHLLTPSPASRKQMPGPARLAAGFISLGAAGVATWVLVGIVRTGGTWLDYLIVVVLLVLALDFGVNGARRGTWPLVGFFG
jgi:hypothetical protein